MLRKAAILIVAFALPALAGEPNVTTFKVRIENVSTPSTLKLSNGQTAPAPVSPGTWTVANGTFAAFIPGKSATDGLESQAEEGNPEMFSKSIQSHVGHTVKSTGVFNTPVGDFNPGALLPGKAYEFTVTAAPGDSLVLTTMFAQSNDWFYAPAAPIALFDKSGKPISGDITKKLALWDAGTEQDEEPGLGTNQAPRQNGPNTGPAENGIVHKVNGPYKVPQVTKVIRVTITPEPGAMMGEMEKMEKNDSKLKPTM